MRSRRDQRHLEGVDHNVALGIGVAGVGIGVWVLLSGHRGELATRVASAAPRTAGECV